MQETSLYANTAVLELKPKDFDIKARKILLKKDGFLMCYSITCPHCRNKVTMWTKLANKLKNTDFVIASLDCAKYREISSALEISRIPRIFYFNKQGQLEDYTSELTPNALLNYACQSKNLLCNY